MGRLSAALAPFDQNREVAPYRKYLPGEPDDYRGMVRGRELARLDRTEVPVTWAHIVAARNVDSPEGHRWSVDDTGAYELSTYNPDSQWDSWGVGGDSESGYFRHYEGCEWQVMLGHDEPWDRRRATLPPGHCHGGPKSSLDLDGLRAETVDGVAATHQRWLETTAGTPEARPWREFYRQATESHSYSMAKAEKDYFAQPRVRVLEGTEFESRRLGCAVEAFQKPRQQLLDRARLVAVPGWATLTTDCRWLEMSNPGRIGFPPKDEDIDRRYLEDANAYIDALPDTTWLVAVDCHI